MAGRRDQRLEREREREQAERRQRLIGYLVAGGLVLATVVVVAIVLLAGGDDAPDTNALNKAAAAAGCSVKTYPEEGRTHVDGKVRYATNPPTSGDHFEIPSADGVLASAPPPERWVHTLEHGLIILQYRPAAPAAVRDSLQRVLEQDSAHMVLMPNNTGMPFEVAAVAWRHVLGCSKYSERTDAALRAFRDAYRDTAPEQVP